MESPNISVRIRRHETLPCIPKHENLPRIRRHESVPCHGLHGTRIHSSAKALNEQRNNRAYATASVLIGRRLGSTKNNPYVGSFRHSPPTSLRSMAASSLPPLSSRKEAASKSSFLFSPSFAFAANSPYVGWFRHAPPVISSYNFLGTSASEMKNQKHKSGKRQGARKPPRKSSVVQHKIKRDSLLELDRWHHQLTSLLLGVDNEDTDKRPPLLLREIINGRLLGGSGEDDKQLGDRSIIQRCNNIYRPNTPLALSNSSGTRLPGYKNTVISRLTSWLLFPLVYADDECYDDDYRSINGDYRGKKTTGGLKYLLSAPTDERSIEIDSDENDDDDDYSSASSVDYDPVGESSISPETEREFSAEANLSISEISEAYYAHQLLDERRRRSNSDTTTTSQQSGLSPSSLNHAREEDNRQRLDYEITQMDIARMTRNASRHLDVDSILNLPTIVYRKRSSSSPRSQNTEQSFHHVCTPIREDRSSDSDSHGSSLILQGEETIHSEDGWSFMMVSGTKPPTVRSTKERRCKIIGMGNEDDHKAAATGGTDDMCVICLEPFKDGDRLRVLPCNHSFHVGCIDRWLSGSHSHNECFTAGCPTCKKRPTSQSSSMQMSTLEVVEAEEENGMSGSLPSWAFANLGSVMAMSTGDFLDDN